MLKYKYSNEELLNYLTRASPNRIDRLLNCGTSIKLKDTGKEVKISCHDPLCLNCQEAIKKRENAFVAKIIPQIVNDYNFCFLTINFPSVHISEYRKTIMYIHKIFNKLCTSKELITIIKGFLSKIDLGKINKAGKINLHIHSVLIMLKDAICDIGLINSLINKYSVKYYDQEIQNIYIKEIEKDDVQRVSNYCVKPINYFHSKADLKNYVNIIDTQRKKIKLYGYGGIYKDMRSNIIKTGYANDNIS